ncbi:hypothetical protein [Streptomyces dioscori]|uniref:hypothetical protein n=1 Tax=Streptomyces dioscori TaxID=2109333 RepID=UPI0018FEB8C5|nr:hypothetical protein [Streptomyces dioscori]
MKNDRRLRRLVVDDTTWYWTLRQRVRPAYEDCSLTLSLYSEDRQHRVALVFRPRQNRIISNCCFLAGCVVRMPDQGCLNLYEPGTVRLLLDLVLPTLDLSLTGKDIEVDGWPYFDVAVEPASTPTLAHVAVRGDAAHPPQPSKCC